MFRSFRYSIALRSGRKIIICSIDSVTWSPSTIWISVIAVLSKTTKYCALCWHLILKCSKPYVLLVSSNIIHSVSLDIQGQDKIRCSELLCCLPRSSFSPVNMWLTSSTTSLFVSMNVRTDISYAQGSFTRFIMLDCALSCRCWIKLTKR